MKSDREFIDGIYAKAEIRKNEKPSFLKSPKTVWIPVAAAAMLFITYNLSGDFVRMKWTSGAEGNSTSQANLEHSKQRMVTMEYEVEGDVVEVLDSYMGYGRIKVAINAEKSDLMESEPIVLAYPETKGNYRKGDNIKATLIPQIIGTQEYYVIVNGKE